jgi:hypothetical protein
MRCGQREAPPKVGLQLLDAVTVTDARAGITSELYRVRGIEEVYNSTKEALVFERACGADLFARGLFLCEPVYLSTARLRLRDLANKADRPHSG